MNKIIDLIKKYRHIIAYLFFGVCTTAVNIVSYYLFYNILSLPNVPANIIAWVLAVAFAFVTNKLFVFDSNSREIKTLGREILSFLACRIFTGVLDIAIMFVAVDVLKMNSLLWKIISNVLVIVLNYMASKLIIFRKKSRGGEEETVNTASEEGSSGGEEE